jgi:hypothetical protein
MKGGAMAIEPSLTIDPGNGEAITASMAAWLGAIIVALPANIRGDVCRLADQAMRQPRVPLVGGGVGAHLSLDRPPAAGQR